jgi:hypothetical protein
MLIRICSGCGLELMECFGNWNDLTLESAQDFQHKSQMYMPRYESVLLLSLQSSGVTKSGAATGRSRACTIGGRADDVRPHNKHIIFKYSDDDLLRTPGQRARERDRRGSARFLGGAGPRENASQNCYNTDD